MQAQVNKYLHQRNIKTAIVDAKQSHQEKRLMQDVNNNSRMDNLKVTL